MDYESNQHIIDAITAAQEWVSKEGCEANKLKPASIARRMVRLPNEELSEIELSCHIAAFSLLLGQFKLTAGNVAWLVREATIGFPDRPELNFLQAFN